MWPWIIAAVVFALGMFLLPPLLGQLPRPKRGGSLGPALSAFNAIFNPAERQVEAARRQRPAERTNDAPDKEPDNEPGVWPVGPGEGRG